MREPVTAIVPTFLHARYLRSFLDSLLKQTYPTNILFVPVWGDSNTLDILCEAKAVYPDRVDFVVSKYAALPHQINLGFSKVHTKYAFLAGSDDHWFFDAVENMVRHAEENHAVVVYPNLVVWSLRMRKDVMVQVRPTTLDYDLLERKCYITDCSLVRVDVMKKFLPMVLGKGNRFIWNIWLAIAREYPDRVVNMPEIAFRYNRKRTGLSYLRRKSKFKRHHPVCLGPPPEGYDWPILGEEPLDHFAVVYTREPDLLTRYHKLLTYRKVLVDWSYRDWTGYKAQNMLRFLHLSRTGTAPQDVDVHIVDEERTLEWWLWNDVYEGLN